jgi:hypothetical protein
LARFLLEHDYAAKSWKSADRILATVPEQLRHYWFRGLMDADGSWIYNDQAGRPHLKMTGFSVASGFEQDWTYLTTYLDTLNIEARVVRRSHAKGNHSSIVICNNRAGAIILGETLYRDYGTDGIGLKRKRDNYLDIRAYHEAHKTNPRTRRRARCDQVDHWFTTHTDSLTLAEVEQVRMRAARISGADIIHAMDSHLGSS